MAAINSLKAFARASKDEVESDVSRSDLYMINPMRIREEEGFNARGAFCEGDYYERPEVKARIRMFAEAYKRGDHIDPIVVKVIDGEIFVREGHRACEAYISPSRKGQTSSELRSLSIKAMKLSRPCWS